MCRFLAYRGDAILLETLVSAPAHSLIDLERDVGVRQVLSQLQDLLARANAREAPAQRPGRAASLGHRLLA